MFGQPKGVLPVRIGEVDLVVAVTERVEHQAAGDAVDLCGGPAEACRIVWGAARRIDWDKLLTYARRMGSVSAAQRLGYFCDLSDAGAPAPFRAGLKALIKPSSRSFLGPPDPRPGAPGYVPDWRLIVHLPEQALLADVPRTKPARP